MHDFCILIYTKYRYRDKCKLNKKGDWEIMFNLRLLSIILGLAFLHTSHAATFTYSGTLEHIFVDDGTGSYTGAKIGDTFSGHYTTEDSVNDVTPILPCLNDACEYASPGPSTTASISNGAVTKAGTDTLVIIWDQYDLEVDDAAFINVLPGISWAVGTPLDGWLGDAVLDDGSQIEIGFISLDTSLYSSRDYQALPPDLNNTDLAFFTIEEFDSFGNTTFLGFGRLDTVQVIPIPAAVWLFGTGLIGLIGIARRKKA